MDTEYFVVAVKATRKPTLIARAANMPVAYVTADNHYAIWRTLSNADLSATGVSFRIYDYDPCGIEIGDPDFVFGKPALMSWGGA